MCLPREREETSKVTDRPQSIESEHLKVHGGTSLGDLWVAKENSLGEHDCQPESLHMLCSNPASPRDHPGLLADLTTHISFLLPSSDKQPTCVPPGAVPGTAEQGPGHQVDPAAGAGHQDREAEPGAFVRAVHQQPQETAGQYSRRERPPGLGAQGHAGHGGGLQEQVSSRRETR